MENNTIRNIFKKDIEFKFKLEDLFTLQLDYDDYNSDGYAYIEELKNKVKEETLATIVNHIFNQLKPAIQDIKDIIYEEVREYRKNAEIIIKKFEIFSKVLANLKASQGKNKTIEVKADILSTEDLLKLMNNGNSEAK